MQIRRVFSLVLCAALLLGLMALPAAASGSTPTLIDEIEVILYAPPLGAAYDYNSYISTSVYEGFVKEGGTRWEHMFDGETDVGFYPMQSEEVFECGETYYLNMSFVPEEGYAFSPDFALSCTCDNGRELGVDYVLTQDGTVNITIAYIAGPGFMYDINNCYGELGDEVGFYANVDGEEYVDSFEWQYSTDGGTTWTADTSADGFELIKVLSADNDGWLYRCTLTDVYGYSAVSNTAKLALFKPLESINILTSELEAGMRTSDLKVLDDQGNDITHDEQGMIDMYHYFISLYFGVKDSDGNWSYPSYIVSGQNYYLCAWFYNEGMGDEYYITDDTTFSINGEACTEVENQIISGEARLAFTVEPSVYTLDLTDGPVVIPAEDAVCLIEALNVMSQGNSPRLDMDVVYYDESMGVTPGNISLYGSVDYLLDLDFYDSYDVCIHEMNGEYTAYQLSDSSLYGSYQAELYGFEKESLGNAEIRFYEVIEIIPDYEELALGEITFDEPVIGSSDQPELYVALNAGFFLEYDGWELVVVEDGETAFTDFDEFEAGRTYAIACEVHADGKAITPDTVFTAVSTGGRSAEVVLDDWDPEGHLGYIVIYYTVLGSAITEQPRDAYGDDGDTVSFHTEVEGDVSYRWQYSKDGGETWRNNSTAAVGYNTDTLSMGVNSTRDGYLYRCKLTDTATGETYFTDTARLIMRKPIASVDLYIAEPVIGESLYDVTMLDAQGNELSYEELDALYPFSLEYWFQSQTQSQVFTAGETLEFLVSAYISEWTEDDQGNMLYEYYFDENTVFTVNGVACTVFDDYLSPISITVYREYEIVLPEIEEVLFSFTAPNAGDTNYGWEQLVPISWDENNGVYHLMTEESCWYAIREENEDTWFDYEFETFEAGETYYFDVMAYSEIAGFTENTQYVVTDDDGNVYEPYVDLDPEWPQSVYIRVAYTCGTPVSITADLEDYVGPENSTASFTVQAEGTGLTYQWWVKKATATKFSKSSITGPVYEVELTAARNGNQVYCIVTDAFGETVQTNAVSMTISDEPAVLEILADLEDYVGPENSTATFTVQAAGEGLTYQWWVKKPSAIRFSKSSITGPVYEVELTAARNGNQVYCIVTDAYGNTEQTNTVSMTIADEPAALEILADLEDYVGPENSTATFTVQAAGEDLTYQWWVKKPSATKFSQSSITGPVYEVELTAARNGNQVYCIVTDAFGNTAQTNTVTMTIEGPVTK